MKAALNGIQFIMFFCKVEFYEFYLTLSILVDCYFVKKIFIDIASSAGYACEESLILVPLGLKIILHFYINKKK
jgi:hypothetical protein